MVQIRFAVGSRATGGRSWKPFSLPLKKRGGVRTEATT